MSATLPPLIEVLRQTPEPQKRRGGHPLAALLAVACTAMLCGYRGHSAIAEWGRNYDPALLQGVARRVLHGYGRVEGEGSAMLRGTDTLQHEVVDDS